MVTITIDGRILIPINEKVTIKSRGVYQARIAEREPSQCAQCESPRGLCEHLCCWHTDRADNAPMVLKKWVDPRQQARYESDASAVIDQELDDFIHGLAPRKDEMEAAQ